MISAAGSSRADVRPLFAGYSGLDGVFDELFGHDGVARPGCLRAADALDAFGVEGFARQQAIAEAALLRQGITFAVYDDARGTEKVWPFCLLPRIIPAAEWARVERGLVQRVAALEAFLADVYGAQRILAEKVIPPELVLGARHFLPQVKGIRPPGGVRIHVAGIDLIRGPDGTFRVLEDNLRTPSGVSYVLENRLLSKRAIPEVLDVARAQPVDEYPARLAEALRSVAPVDPEEAGIVVLTPGPLNSAYFEHTFLARSMGLQLVEGGDLFVEGDRVFLRTTRGPWPVHGIYRRVDDAFLDPEAFRADSLIGVRGLLRAWARGQVAIANAPGNGVADDKAIYPFVPDMIRFYLSEEPLLEQVPTFVCLRDRDRDHVVRHLGELVVKSVDEAGGYGMLVGPQASREQRETFHRQILDEPRRYVAQPLVELSTCPTWIGGDGGGRVEPRRVDLRPFAVTSSRGVWVLPGGLTRVALRRGSYVVNSSQGGGSKDTWVQKAVAP